MTEIYQLLGGMKCLKCYEDAQRVLETKEFTPVGSNKVLKSKFRIVSAINKSPDEMIQAGFLPDLIARLRQSYIEIPPLRMRPEDIALLIKHQQQLRQADVEISKEASQYLSEQEWPTNVRGLLSFLEELFDKSRISPISQRAAESLYSTLFPPSKGSLKKAVRKPSAAIKQQIETMVETALGNDIPLDFIEFELLSAYTQALESKFPSLSLRETAKACGLSYSRLHRILKKTNKS